MPSEKLSISLPTSALQFIDERGGRSATIACIVVRYAEIVRRHLPQFSAEEWGLICEVAQSQMKDPPHAFMWISCEVEDAILTSGLADKYGINGEALVNRMRALTPAQRIAVVDAAEKHLAEVARGERPAFVP